MSLRARLLLLVSLATLVPASLLGIRFFQNRSAEIEEALNRLAARANYIATDLDVKVQGTAQLHFGLTRAVDLDTPNRAECSAFLSAVREEYPQYTGILTISPDGKLFCDSLQSNRDLDLRDREYFREALQAKNTVTLQPAFGRLTGISVLQIAYPARSASGEVKFVLLASFNLQQFAEFHNVLSGTADILLLDKNGTVLVSPSDTSWIKRTGTSIKNTDLFRFAAGPSAGRAQEVADFDGRKQFWVAVRTPAIRDAGLYIMVGVSKANLVAAANTRLYQELVVVAIVSLLLFAGVLSLAEVGVRREVWRIAAMAKKLGAGDLSVRIAPPYPGGELGGLMTELNAAAGSLERQHAAIDDLNQKLNRSQQMEARAKIFLDTVIEHIPLSIAVNAAPESTEEVGNWQITLVNKAYETLTGLSRTELIGRSVRDLYPKQIADIIAASDEDTLDSSEAMVVREFSLGADKNCARVIVSKKVAIRDDSGKVLYLLTVLDDVTDKRRDQQRIARMAHYDALTDLPNRAAFNGRFASTIGRAAANGERFTILSIDLDRVKETNDVHGHSAGDALLQEAARRLQVAAGSAFIARIGGDEFTVIVEGEQTEIAKTVAERLLAVFVDDFVIDGKHIQIGLGIGGAVYPTDGLDAKTLMVSADAALYRAKAEPINAVLFFQPEMTVHLQERHALQQDLRHAIARGEMRLHYQPQFRMTGEVTGFEALARWQCPSRGMIQPSTFIPIAEEYNLIVPIGEWALREACREAASWSQPLTVAVNVSPIQFRHGDLARLVHSILLETGLAPARLELEITEGVLINDFSRAVSILCQLKALGVQIALDDFGTGYSSLSYLHSFSFDKIKIDRTFISDLEHNRHSVAIVRAVIELGHSLNVPILAEGVETEHQRLFLVNAVCDQMQGYLTGRPLPITDYKNLTESQKPVLAQPLALVS